MDKIDSSSMVPFRTPMDSRLETDHWLSSQDAINQEQRL